MRLDGKTALITGSGGGIGRALALGFARAGGNIVVADYNFEGAQETSRMIEALPARVIALQADVSSATSVQIMVEKAVEAFGSIDVLVNNAGRAGQVPFLEMTEAEWDRVLNTNLKGVWLCCKAVAPQMIKQGGGRIVNISSALGVKGALSSCHYSASKGGVNALTRSLASELRPYNIEVMAAGPGQTETPMWQSMYSEKEKARRKEAGEVRRPEEFVDLVLFLASDRAKGLSGQVILSGVYFPS